ncbi:MAG: tyrosine-type recombinase/integrase [Gemmataceae bacterium]
MTSDASGHTSLPTIMPAVGSSVPALFLQSGEKASRRLLEWLTADIRNPNTRQSYARAIQRFSAWCHEHGLRLEQLTPIHAAAYVESLGRELAKPTVKQHLAALRMLGNYLITGQVIVSNPFGPVRGPKYVVKKGKTPVLTAEEMRQLLASIDTETIAGKRDAALIAVMAYSFARISAVLGMDVGDYRLQGKRCWLALHEKGGKEHEVPCHHKAEEYLDAYIQAAGIGQDCDSPLFRTLDRRKRLTTDRLDRREALAMVKRRSLAAGLGVRLCNHSFRATGITVYLQNEGTIEKAQAIAAHESPRTTKLYDRTQDELTLDEIERIRF